MPTIKIKNSQTATNTPGSLVQGELAINEQDKILFYRDGAGAVQSFNLAATIPTTTDDLPEGSTNKYAAGNEVVSDTYITNLEAVTQAQYDALSPPDANTFYTIVTSLPGPPLPSTPYLDSVLASASGDLDATFAASYSGSGQTWSNLIASPADSSAQTDYDMFLGATGTATSDDPTFTGTPDTSSAYFLMDGGDHFTMKTNPTLVDQLQADNGQSWWLAVAFQYQGTAQNTILFSTGGLPAEQGMEVFVGDVGNGPAIRTRLNHNRNATRTVNNFNTAGYYTAGSDYLVVISYDHTTDTIRLWKNGTGETSADINSDTGTLPATSEYEIGKRVGGSNNLPNGTRIYHQSFGNAFLSDGDEAAIRAHLETRHGRTYNAA
jgi:hypothetical protein